MKQQILIITVLSVLCCINFNLVSSASEANPTVIDYKEKERYDIYEWRYKLINGKLYRRLYNLTASEWVGDWELVL